MAKLLTCVLGKPEDPKRNPDDDDVDEQDQKVEKLLENWNPPEVRVSDIYQLRRGNSVLELLYRMLGKEKPVFKSTVGKETPLVKIETIKKAVLIKDEYEEFPLLGRDVMGKYMRWYHSVGVRRYGYVHVGLIQVAVKPLTRNGLNSSVVICICDKRFLRFSYSLLALSEFSLCDGPVYFNCHPCYIIPLEDHEIFNLKVQTRGLYHDGNSDDDIAVVYRVCYMLSSTCFVETRKKVSFSRGNTTIIETNLLKGDVSVPRTISWDSIEEPTKC